MSEQITCVVESAQASSASVGEWLMIVVLICLSALFSGLTLGLLGLGKSELEILMESGSPSDQSHAKKIYPLRKRGNLLLCTLLLGNVAVNALLSILMAGITSGTVGFLASTASIVILGEIVPQALCSRYALMIGSHTVYIVYVFLVVLFPIAYPISRALDWVLGEELGTIYTRGELATLVAMHAMSPTSDVSASEASILRSALAFSAKTVAEVMTPVEQVFMLDVNRRLDADTLAEVMDHGFSRVPVFEGDDRTNVVGLLFVKDLALLDPDDSLPLRTVLAVYNRRLPKVFSETKLDKMLSLFQSGRSHIALVYAVRAHGDVDPVPTNVGIVTLEDVIEELIGQEILDETDIYLSTASSELASRPSFAEVDEVPGPGAVVPTKGGSSSSRAAGPTPTKQQQQQQLQAQQRLIEQHQQQQLQQSNRKEGRQSDRKLPLASSSGAGPNPLVQSGSDGKLLLFRKKPQSLTNPLSEQQIDVVAGVLGRLTAFSRLPSDCLRRLVGQAPREFFEVPAVGSTFLYERGKPSTWFTFLLSGRLEVTAGEEQFVSHVGQFSHLGLGALTAATADCFVPDFAARVIEPTHVLQISRHAFMAARDSVAVKQLAAAADKADKADAVPSGESTVAPVDQQATSDSTDGLVNSKQDKQDLGTTQNRKKTRKSKKK